MREKRWFPVLYMFVVTAFFSSIVIGLAQFTKSRVEANRTLAFERAVLAVLPGLFDSKASSLEQHRRYLESVTGPDKSTGQAWSLRKDGEVVAYALPISGKGFWAPIKGVIGIAADRKTITGIAFYEQNETPGLGAQITTAEFTSQFNGKVIAVGRKPLVLRRPGELLGQSEVHAVTGATQTSTRLEKIINTGLLNWKSQFSERSNEE